MRFKKLSVFAFISLVILGTSILGSMQTVLANQSLTVSHGSFSYFPIELTQGDEVKGTISVTGGSNAINYWVTNPAGQQIISKTLIQGGTSFDFTAQDTGTFTFFFDNSIAGDSSDKSVLLAYDLKRPPLAGGCLIATAAFGSPMAPQVQQLRETRDNVLLHTQSGTAFMLAFNQFYYTFSPTVADWERQNAIFREMVKITITPLITTLAILNYVKINSEAEMLFYGISVILLNIAIYFVLPIFTITKLKRYLVNPR